MISLGVDIGGTGCKCVAFSETGVQLAQNYEEYPLAAGSVNLPPETLAESVFRVIRACAQALENTKLPVIMVHGKADDFVPHEMGVENYNAIPGDKLLLSVENATHGVSFLVEKERIWKELLAFFDRNDTKNTQAKGLRT